MSERELPYPDKPVGMGGWLMFYTWCICIILPFYGISKMLELHRSLEDMAKQYDWFMMFWNTLPYTIAMIVIFNVAMVWLLYASDRRITRNIVVVLIWLVGPGLVLFLLAPVMVYFPPEARDVFVGQSLNRGAIAVLWSTLWTLYFLRSKRVANTYWR
ncbi:DUF2569 family protein [Vreelandella sp. EE7]